MMNYRTFKSARLGLLLWAAACFAPQAEALHLAGPLHYSEALHQSGPLLQSGSQHQSAGSQHLVEVGMGYSQTSVNTAVFRASSLVTKGRTQFVAYYDADGFLVLGKREQGSEVWTLKRSTYKGKVHDAHNVISIGVDADGFLHVAFDHHGQPLNYARSKAPYSLELGPLQAMTGRDENDVTYPEFYNLPDGRMLFAYRSGASGRGNLVLNRYDVRTRRWTTVQSILISGEDQRNAYWQMCVDARGTIHLSWVWRETWMVETNHDLCYARSRDGGDSWETSDGTPYTLPITAANAEYALRIPQNSELINQTSMTTDDDGRPYIATYWRDKGSKVPQYRLVWKEGGRWKSTQVGRRTQPFTLSGGGTKMILMSRPRLAVRRMGKAVEAYFLFRDAERGSKVSMAYCADLKKGRWQTTDLTDFAVDAWEPTYDTQLWTDSRRLQLFVQRTAQGDGEQTAPLAPQPVYVLEVDAVADKPGVAEIKEILTRANRYWQQHNSPLVRSFWDNAAYHTGNIEAYTVLRDTAMLAYSKQWAAHNEWKGAREPDRAKWRYSYGESNEYVLFGDYQICFQTYADLYRLEPDYRKIARAQEVMEHQMVTGRNDYWWWADGLYMVMPVMVKLYNLTGHALYLDKLYEYLSYAESIMLDPETGLLYRDAKYIYPKHTTASGKKDFWARGDGWVLAGLAKVIQDLPYSDPHRDHYVSRFRQMAASVAACQQPEGYWTRSMLDKDFAPGPETSGTAFFCYGLQWGVNHGLLDAATYQPVADKAWTYLSTVALQSDGRVGYVQPIGEKAIPGQVVDANSTANFGVGAFLLAGSERISMLNK